MSSDENHREALSTVLFLPETAPCVYGMLQCEDIMRNFRNTIYRPILLYGDTGTGMSSAQLYIKEDIPLHTTGIIQLGIGVKSVSIFSNLSEISLCKEEKRKKIRDVFPQSKKTAHRSQPTRHISSRYHSNKPKRAAVKCYNYRK